MTKAFLVGEEPLEPLGFTYVTQGEYDAVVIGSLQLHELSHARIPCPSLSPGVGLNSCPLSQ